MNDPKNYALYRMAAVASFLIALALLVCGLVAKDLVVMGFAAIIIVCSLTSYPLIRQKHEAAKAERE